MIDFLKVQEHPCTMIVAQIEGVIMGLKDSQKNLVKVICEDTGFSYDILIKAMNLASQDMQQGINND
jgi:hypothetical protein